MIGTVQKALPPVKMGAPSSNEMHGMVAAAFAARDAAVASGRVTHLAMQRGGIGARGSEHQPRTRAVSRARLAGKS